MRAPATIVITCFISLVAFQVLGQETPAHKALRSFQKGANLGNYLEAPKGQSWGKTYTVKDLDAIKSEGFDHIRLPARWNAHTAGGPEFLIEPSFMGKVDLLVTNALRRDLGVIVNIHHFDEFTTDPDGEKAKLLAIWKQVSRHYQGAPEKLAFEILNEPKDAATTEVMNRIYLEVIAVIRQSNPNRTIFIAPGKWNSLDEVARLQLPESDQNLIVTVHSYEPFLFTHQGAPWPGPDTVTRGIVYPGPPSKPLLPDPSVTNKSYIVKWFEEYNTLPSDQNPSGPKAFRTRMEKVNAWSKAKNRPIHLGEFGAYQVADANSRARFYRDMRQEAEKLGWGWAIWDWSAGFKYWNGSAPVPGMREALFGK